jgi:hypothetical protein
MSAGRWATTTSNAAEFSTAALIVHETGPAAYGWPTAIGPNGEGYDIVRADHFPFAKRGVPTLLLMGIGGGHDLVAGGREAGDRWVTEFTDRCYHQACDRWNDAWDLRGAAQDVTLVLEMTRELAGSRAWPQWHAGTEFKATRDTTGARRKY